MRTSVCVVAVLASVASVARADPGEDTRAAAEALYDRGKALVADGNYAAACDAYASSAKLDPALGTRLNLADCYEHVGKTASAWVEYREIEEAEHAKGAATAHDAEREQFAHDHAAALAPKLSRLVIRVTRPARGLVVTRDGADVTASVGVDVPLDPGVHAIAAHVPGGAGWTQTVTIAGEGTTATVVVPALAGAATGGDYEDGGGRGRRRATEVTAAAAGALIGVATYAFFEARSNRDHARELGCSDSLTACPQGALDTANDAFSDGQLATGFAIAGAAVATAAVVLWLTRPNHFFHLAPAVAAGQAGVSLGGSF